MQALTFCVLRALVKVIYIYSSLFISAINHSENRFGERPFFFLFKIFRQSERATIPRERRKEKLANGDIKDKKNKRNKKREKTEKARKFATEIF